MPLYDYKCTNCGYIFEVQQRISEEPLKHCPKCKGHINRLITPAGIIFKGSGFHITDYRKKTEPKTEGPKTEKKETKKEEKKSESKEVSQ